MFAVFQVSVRRALRMGLRFPALRVPAAGCAGSVSRSEAAASGVRAVRGPGYGQDRRSCTVDPNLEEEFVFVDFTDPEESLSLTSAPPPSLTPPLTPLVPPPRHLRSVERQLQVLQGVAQQEAETDSLIQFHDVDFPLDEDVVESKKKKKKKAGKGEHKVFGTPDVDEPVSDTCCSGCGAVLHCTDTTVPGYLPSEKYKVLLQEERLSGATCQRCHLLTHHHKALNLHLPADQYRTVVRQVQPLRALVLLIVDLLDLPDSIVPDLPDLVGTNKQVVVLGNKIDLLPGDSPNYLQRIKRQLSWYCEDAGFGSQMTGVHLISAKTGYGVESLISDLQRSWRYKGDVYLVGSANAGKSTLFNTLLQSDYCKSKASDSIHKATISPWPGTTLNLLKFPIMNPTPYRMFRRRERLNEAATQTESELSHDELRTLTHLSRRGYLVGHSSLMFSPDEMKSSLILTVCLLEKMTMGRQRAQILNLLTEQEVMSVVPSQAIVPRTFVLKPGTSLFVGAMARIDFVQGGKSCWFSVMASSRVPVHITSLEKADAIYEKHAGHILLGVPLGGLERMKDFPPLLPQEFRLEGRGYLEAATDIKLSSAGWVAVTAPDGDQLVLRVHGPEAAGFNLRTPPLLPHVIALKGERIRKTAAYKPIKPLGLLAGGMSDHGAERLQMQKKKKKT
ncbi:Nitric oxide-associated protein 1 [Nibea albiflora]|uniref:Nitric oxide-associated protein 1 n=1 Tax=Nibea albiflora TaxID=240163 RepID=A0ACB7ERE7_NIBAL|nr:Nitric oxide-associated protein 1 [Nibea albiflora]